MLDLKVIKEQLAGATPGPWRFVYDPNDDERNLIGVDGSFVDGDTDMSGADEAFIASAHAHIESLLAEVEALRGHINRWAANPVANFHHSEPDPNDLFCEWCGEQWPCPLEVVKGWRE